MTTYVTATNPQGRTTHVTSRLSPDALRAHLESLGWSQITVLDVGRAVAS